MWMARPRRDIPLVVDVNNWWWWYDDGTYAFPNPIRGTKDHDKQQRCKSAHAKIDLWGKNIQSKLDIHNNRIRWQISPKKRGKNWSSLYNPRSPRRRRRRAVISRLPPFGALHANPLSFFLSRSRLLQLATVTREPEANGRELRVLTAHPMADSSLALPLLDNFLSPVLSHWEELRAWIILLAVFSR